MGTLSLPNHRPAPRSVVAPIAYCVVEAVLRPTPSRQPVGRGQSVVTAQDRRIMRDLVLGAFLGPQHYREDDGTYVAPYTCDNTREAFPRHLEPLRDCPTDNGPTGRLPAAYVAALAKGTTRVIATETRPKKKPSVPLGPLAFQDAHIVQAVGKLQPEHLHWIRYAYADSTDWADEAGAVIALWEAYAPKLGKVQAKTIKTAQGLAHLAVQNAKRSINSGKELHAPARLRELLGVTEANWDKHWAPRWRALNDQVHALDAAALGTLCRRLKGYKLVLMDRGV